MNIEKDRILGYLIAENDWKYVVKISPNRDFKELKTFIKYTNSDYKIKFGEKFKYVLVPQMENGEYFLYGVTTNIIPCKTKNAQIDIICDYNTFMAEEISDLLLKSQKLAMRKDGMFLCSMFFVFSLELNGAPKEYDKYYCYEWYNVDNDYVFYVGKGKNNRWKQTSLERRNESFIEYYNTHNCSCRFVKINMSEEDAYLAEKERLKYLHKIGQAHCNHDGGGRCGATNYGAYNGMYHNTHTNEVKKKLSDINKVRQARGNNVMAKPVYVYTKEMIFLKQYSCVPDAVDDLFGFMDEKEKVNMRSRVYQAMKNNSSLVNGYHFSRKEIS